MSVFHRHITENSPRDIKNYHKIPHNASNMFTELALMVFNQDLNLHQTMRSFTNILRRICVPHNTPIAVERNFYIEFIFNSLVTNF
jgi:hypothetical protein